ncbi:hypothetical protein [Qipengyuania nanhaisediminis]|uniref:Uncharacterized protein n=1 Tax=Qipengyuania nanhaisediminis TaxID=604088 RepID=A0A1I5KDG6_9SPHN|nr:hypothetical protein [Qipengyuania nanhaisediminis]SFO83112.1 hypothetical protein SAMN04488060_0123 [Qipengyuania nanhaisediminis]
MVRPDPLESQEAPQDLRYILATLSGGAALLTGLAISWNVIQGGTFTGNVGSEMSFSERLATGIFIALLGAGLLNYAVRGMRRLKSPSDES